MEYIPDTLIHNLAEFTSLKIQYETLLLRLAVIRADMKYADGEIYLRESKNMEQKLKDLQLVFDTIASNHLEIIEHLKKLQDEHAQE